MGEFTFTVVLGGLCDPNLFMGSLSEQGVDPAQIQLICRAGEKDSPRYANKNNILSIKACDLPVPAFFNAAMEHIKGELVVFIPESADYSPNTFKNVYRLFTANANAVDVAALPVYFNDGKEHILNYKFRSGSRLLNISNDKFIHHLCLCGCFFKAEAVKGLRLEQRVCYGAFTKFIHEALLPAQSLLLVGEGGCTTTREQSGAPQKAHSPSEHFERYLVDAEYYLKPLLSLGTSPDGKCPAFIQHTVMADMVWRIRQRGMAAIGSNADRQKYISLMTELLGGLDEDIILSQGELLPRHRYAALSLKYNERPKYGMVQGAVRLAFSNGVGFSINECDCYLDFLRIEEGLLKLEGHIDLYGDADDLIQPSFYFNNERLATTITPRDGGFCHLGVNTVTSHYLTASIPLERIARGGRLRLGAELLGSTVFFSNYNYRYFSPITSEQTHPSYKRAGIRLTAAKSHIQATPSRGMGGLRHTLADAYGLCKMGKEGFGALLLRLKYHLVRFFKRRPLWLISDRVDAAGDNGEAFFRYMRAEHPNIDARFVINKDAPDYQRMKKIGPVLPRAGKKHFFATLLSELVISAHGENEHFDPIPEKRPYFRDILANKPFIFLQHGITKDNMSAWLNRYNKNISGFVVAAGAEYASVKSYDYYYSEDNIWLTGFPRFDRLYNDPKGIISITPTWRKYLSDVLKRSEDKEFFKQSEFFRFYSALITDRRLLAAAGQNGYKIQLVLHPNFRAFAELFSGGEVSVITQDVNYNKLFAESDLLLTDYSSTVFDFVYLKKPIVYAHFDHDAFFGGMHSYEKGYFDYERDGFGEVEYELNSTVDRLVEYMEGGCAMKEKYLKRVGEFFAFNDQNNSKRLYERLLQAGKK